MTWSFFQFIDFYVALSMTKFCSHSYLHNVHSDLDAGPTSSYSISDQNAEEIFFGGVNLTFYSTPIETVVAQTERKENGSTEIPRWYVYSEWSPKYYISNKTL